MGVRSYDQSAREMYRVTFNLPEVVGGYATETIVFGPCASDGDMPANFREITALVEGSIANGTLELWLPKVPAGGAPTGNNRTIADYFNSGITALSSNGAQRWQLSCWPGAMLRMKSGSAVAAPVTVSATGY